MVVGAAVLVEHNHEQGVPPVGAVFARRVADGLVDLGQEGIAAEERRRFVECQAGHERVDRRMHVVVAVDEVRLDERIRGQFAVGGILVELVGRDEVRGEMVLEACAVDQARERSDCRRVDVDLPAIVDSTGICSGV